jgi:hypothetical protein
MVRRRRGAWRAAASGTAALAVASLVLLAGAVAAASGDGRMPGDALFIALVSSVASALTAALLALLEGARGTARAQTRTDRTAG